VSFIWPADGSIEPKHVAEFLILITNICYVIDRTVTSSDPNSKYTSEKAYKGTILREIQL